jgi:hypothetical protein
MAVKTIVIREYAVGMHHYGRKELHVGVGYKLKREPENKYVLVFGASFSGCFEFWKGK